MLEYTLAATSPPSTVLGSEIGFQPAVPYPTREIVAPVSDSPVAERSAQPLVSSLELTVAALALRTTATATARTMARVASTAVTDRVLDRDMGSLLRLGYEPVGQVTCVEW